MPSKEVKRVEGQQKSGQSQGRGQDGVQGTQKLSMEKPVEGVVVEVQFYYCY